ncbi:MAG: urea transporter, partial [Muribaculaceae bacterium]|nr:urea transporter [Muribaculaceae bacterium]
MSTTTSSRVQTGSRQSVPNQWTLGIRTLLRGAGQVMFQCSSWTGLLFLAGIFWGAYASHTPAVAWG